MSNQPLYRWLEQQGEAFGAPGLEPRWTSSVKDAVGTAYSASSRIWFTCSHGILNEIYHPSIDQPQVRDMEFLVTDGETFVHEEKRDLISTFEYIHPEAIETEPTRPNEIGMHRVAFSVDDLDEALEIAARHGCRPLRGVATYEDVYKLTYVRGPSGIIVMLAEELTRS